MIGLMLRDDAIIGMGVWLKSPAGRYLLEWEQSQFDAAVCDAFGFHALQLGLPEVDGLRANRMPHRWVACSAAHSPAPEAHGPVQEHADTVMATARPAALRCRLDALPFPNDSLDLVLLPHTLELSPDPHQTLREVERVLRPEGRVLVVGLNPASLWGLRQRSGRLFEGNRSAVEAANFLPQGGEFLGYWRLRDWMRLLGLHIDAGRFGCYRPALQTSRWLERFEWMDRIGERWWPVLGAAYFLSAVKRVPGMRLVGLAREARRVGAAAPAVATRREPAQALERRVRSSCGEGGAP